MCFKLLKEIPCVWKVSHLKFKFYFVANRNWWIKLFSSIYYRSFPRQCIQMSLQTDLHGSVSWVRGQESEVLCTCVLRIGRGVIPVCAWPGGGQWAGRGRGKSISCSQECVIGIQMDPSDSLMLLRLSVIVKWWIVTFKISVRHLTEYFSLQLLCLTYCIIMLVGFLWLLSLHPTC